MMKEIKAPERYEHHPDQRHIFIAGGISNCADWRKELLKAFAGTDLVLLNPRRDNYDLASPTMEQEQIEWEHEHLIKADAYLFWFCEETTCPITLFELGKVAGMFPAKPLFVGTHPSYIRKRDIGFQMTLMCPEVHVVHQLDALQDQVIKWASQPSAQQVLS